MWLPYIRIDLGNLPSAASKIICKWRHKYDAPEDVRMVLVVRKQLDPGWYYKWIMWFGGEGADARFVKICRRCGQPAVAHSSE